MLVFCGNVSTGSLLKLPQAGCGQWSLSHGGTTVAQVGTLSQRECLFLLEIPTYCPWDLSQPWLIQVGNLLKRQISDAGSEGGLSKRKGAAMPEAGTSLGAEQ